MKVAVAQSMTTGTEQTTRLQGNPGRLVRPRNTLPFPPPQNSPVTPAKRAVSESLPENLFQDQPESWDDPWEGLFDEITPTPRRWPAVIAFSMTGVVVTLIGVAAVGHLRQPVAANASPAERALEPTQEKSTAVKPDSKDAPLRVDAVIDNTKPQPPLPVEQRQAAEPATFGAKASASLATLPTRAALPPAATQATGPLPSVERHNSLATAKGPSGSTPPTPEKAARAARPSSPRRSVRQKLASHSDNSTPKSQTEAEIGIPVNQIYLNSRGELVDEQGKPLAPKRERTQVPPSDEAEP